MVARTHKIELRISARNMATKALSGVVSSLGSVAKIATGIVASKALVAIGNQVKSMVNRAGQVTDVGIAFERLAHSVGQSKDEMLSALREASQGAITNLDLMKTANEAMLLTGGVLGKDLPQYLKIAGAAAKASGADMQFLFDSLVRGVARGSPMIIDNALLTLDSAAAFQVYADKIGKSVEELSKHDKQMATHEAILRQGQAMMEKLGDSTASLGMQWQQLKTRVQNISDELSAKMAPALSVVMDGLLQAADHAEKAGRAFLAKFGGKMMETAERALRWGVNISTQLATGIVQGASQALVAAMNWIGNLLSSWLSPGSPPKVAPNIDRWGMAAMEEYLVGFTEADFGALKGIQGPLQTALSALVDMGQLGSGEMNKLFSSLSVDIAGMIDQFTATGTVGQDVFDKLLKVGGKFGKHLVKIVQGQLDLAAATKALRNAQERLNQAREKESEAEDRIKKLKREYFALRKAGASPAALKAKLNEIDAAQDGLKAARKEREEAEKAEKEAQKKLDPIQKQISLQEQIVQQLAQMVQMSKESVKMPTIGGGAGGGIGAIPLPTPDMSGFTGSLESAFADAKEKIKEKLKDIFKPFTDAWEQKMKPALAKVSEKWQWFSDILDKFWNSEAVQKIRDWLAKMFPEGTVETIGEWAGKILVLAGALAILAGILAIVTSPLFLLAGAVVILAAIWKKHGDKIKTTVSQLKFIIIWALLQIYLKLEWLKELWLEGWEFIRDTAVDAWTFIRDEVVRIWDKHLKPIWESLKTWFTETLPGNLDTIKTKFETSWQAIKDAVSPVSDFLGNVFDKIKNFGNWLSGHVFNFKLNVPKIPAWAKPGSPIPLHTAWKNFATDMKRMDVQFPAAPTGAGGGRMPAMAAAGGGSAPIQIIVQGDFVGSRQKVREIADAIDRERRLRGIRRLR